MALIFVFGTLKRGFPMADKLKNTQFHGLAQTAQAFPMFVAGGIFGPMMLDSPGRGLRVRGELYDVSPEALAVVDKSEEVGSPGNFRRMIDVVKADGATVPALAFFKHPRLARPRHSGYLADYHDGRFKPKGRRPISQPPLKLLSEVSPQQG